MSEPAAPGGLFASLRQMLATLVDIAQEENLQYIRHPVEEGNPQNIPAGTVRNRPDPSNTRFYPDLGLPGRTFVNPGPRGGSIWTPRYYVRRSTWHTLDHTWEIEDRIVS